MVADGSPITATSSMGATLVPSIFVVKTMIVVGEGRDGRGCYTRTHVRTGGRHVRRRRPRGHRQPWGALPPPVRGARGLRGPRPGPGDGAAPVLAAPPRRAGARRAGRPPPARPAPGAAGRAGATAPGRAPAPARSPAAGPGGGRPGWPEPGGPAAARRVRGPAGRGHGQGP